MASLQSIVALQGRIQLFEKGGWTGIRWGLNWDEGGVELGWEGGWTGMRGGLNWDKTALSETCEWWGVYLFLKYVNNIRTVLSNFHSDISDKL